MSANKLLYSLLPLLVSLYVQMCYFSVQQHGHMHSSTWRGEHVTYRNMANESANYRNLGPMVTSLEGESYIQVVCSHCFNLRARARNIYAFYLLTRWGCVSVSHGYGKIYQWWDYRSFPCHGFTAESAGTCISLLSFKVPTYWRKFFGVCSAASEMAGGIVDVNGIFWRMSA